MREIFFLFLFFEIFFSFSSSALFGCVVAVWLGSHIGLFFCCSNYIHCVLELDSKNILFSYNKVYCMRVCFVPTIWELNFVFVSVDNFYLIESCLFDWWIIFEVMMGLKKKKRKKIQKNETRKWKIIFIFSTVGLHFSVPRAYCAQVNRTYQIRWWMVNVIFMCTKAGIWLGHLM